MNHDVNVLSYYFAGTTKSRCYPRSVEIDGRRTDFLENGLRCLVARGQDFIQIFNMSDGRRLYRMSFEPGERTWKLLSTRVL